ncbi:xyloside xylosyltransferase 1-like [Uloborus diversus]|uniref:xyloside xylosyltransferase 1-like n=1 Tax=Uloborus diversus TaxID=327109 RepID=UPI002409E24A|nr:xyloside xylosyltransferase 1-like [Uloborus diversus]
MAAKALIGFKNFIISFLIITTVFFNVMMLYKGKIINSNSLDFVSNNRQNSYRITSQNNHIDVVFFAKYAFKNMKIIRGLARTLESILKHTKNPIYLHVLLDFESKQRVGRTLKTVCRHFHRSLNVTYYDVNDMAQQNSKTISTIRKHFFSKDVGRYNDDIFFLSEIFHEVFPKRLRQIIFLDIDLKFLDDIQKLYGTFQAFEKQNVIGIGPDLQPQYRMDFSKFRSHNLGTKVGMPRPGRQGYNTGVVLFDLQRMRESVLYNSLINDTSIDILCKKYEFQGYLGHQDFYTLTGMEHPELYYELDCSWNRQLDVGWEAVVGSEIFQRYHECNNTIKVLHANGDAVFANE